MRLPDPRGPLTAHLFERLPRPPHRITGIPPVEDDTLEGDDLHLALYACYELHYRGFEGVDERWEWEPSLLDLRGRLERAFEARLLQEVPRRHGVAPESVPELLAELVEKDDAGSPPLSRYLEEHAGLEQFCEFVIHRSAYQLKEADPHSWALPRLHGRPKAALAEIQADEYGSGVPERMHAELFRGTMDALGMDSQYGAWLGRLPGVTLATVNLMSLLGLHRRWRGAIVGHLAAFEMTSSVPNRRYANGLRRLGGDERATFFYDEHVEADSVHEALAVHDLAGSLAMQEPSLVPDILFGAEALLFLERRFAGRLLESWSAGRPSLWTPAGPAFAHPEVPRPEAGQPQVAPSELALPLAG